MATFETGNLKTKKTIVRFKRNKDEPIEEAQFDSSAAAYWFAIKVEQNGGIAIVSGIEVPKQQLSFD